MKTLQDIVCTYEQAKKLYELGFKKGSIYLHCYPNLIIESKNILPEYCLSIAYHAYTAEELLEALPYQIIVIQDIYVIRIDKIINEYFIYYEHYLQDGFYEIEKRIADKNLTHVIADMLIWCIEEGHIKMEEK